MKKTIFTLIFAVAAMSANAQIFNRYKRNLNKAEDKAEKLLKEGADIILDPIETVPIASKRTLSIAAQTNWGKELLLPPVLQERIRNECAYKVTVKIADTGHGEHASLRQGQLPGKNYTTAASVVDAQGHSTHVTGIIAGDEIGLCDALVDKGLLTHRAIKILADNGSGSFTWVQTAIASERTDDQAIISRGEFVVWNGSFGGGTSIVSSLETEIQKSTDAGAVFLFAAGNTGVQGVNYPGCGKFSIACASLDQSLTRSSYSTMGAEVWAAMPGRNINSTHKGGWAILSGTSMATPFLTAATAIAYSKWGPKLKGLDKVRAYLAWCAKDIVPAGKDTETGWGIALIQNILDRDPVNTPILPGDPNPPPPPPTPGLKSITPLNVVLKTPVKIYWDNVSASLPTSEGRTFKTAGRGSRAANKALALKTSTVWFDISAPSTTTATATAEKLEKEVAAYFTNRGFMLPQGQDESWAAYWGAYFLEMGLQQGASKWGVTVTKATLDTAGGQKVVITDLKHWPIK